MAVYRLAVLSGNSTRLPARFVHHYRLIRCRSFHHALQQARQLNAVVCGWRRS